MYVVAYAEIKEHGHVMKAKFGCLLDHLASRHQLTYILSTNFKHWPCRSPRPNQRIKSHTTNGLKAPFFSTSAAQHNRNAAIRRVPFAACMPARPLQQRGRKRKEKNDQVRRD